MVARGDYGPVLILRGDHKGTVGYYDDDEGGRAVGYLGEPFVSDPVVLPRGTLQKVDAKSAELESVGFPSFPYSSGRYLLRELPRGEIAECRVRTLRVVFLEPGCDHEERLVAAREAVMPETFLLQGPEESLDHPVLLRRVRRNVLLVEAIAPHDVHEDLRAEHEPVIGAQREGRVPVLDPLVAERILQRCGRDAGDTRAR